ncbi:MAG: endonuclease III [Candidatus Eisenbacteria bacterium]|nr:endonuclease III [Candidatus Eisenbacteria bacterium]
MPTTTRRKPRWWPGPLKETAEERRDRAVRILRALTKHYPDAHVPLRYSNALELMVATILSAQCTDERVNEVTRSLFGKYTTAADWASASQKKLEEEIRPTGFYHNKAKAIRESTAELVERYDGRVPDTLDELTSLRGIGRKTANVILAHVYGKPGIIVDTHFIRISRRLALTREFDPVKIEFDVMGFLPEKYWSDFSLLITWHGRFLCPARKPDCQACPVSRLCPASESPGEVTWPVKKPPKKPPRQRPD